MQRPHVSSSKVPLIFGYVIDVKVMQKNDDIVACKKGRHTIPLPCYLDVKCRKISW